ncbi:MAG: hypothetical protein JWN31_148 [Frankiales bacterium]|nr:hypothetical protein [Frankiales bacterium]
MRPRPPEDDGFTLIETLIALVIMSTTIIALVTVLSGVIVTTQFHRGNAVAEDVTHNVVESVVARMAAKTTLTGAVSAASLSLPVQSGSAFSNLGYVNVDDEMMQVVAAGATTITVARVASNVVTHASGASVTAAFRCPSPSQLTPVTTGWSPSGVTATIGSVEYWDPSSSAFVSSATCVTQYIARCLDADGLPGDFRDGCDSGLTRLTIDISTAGDSRYKGVTATTQVLVRRGSA